MITVLAILIGLNQSQPVTPQYQSELDQQSITFMDEYFQHLSSPDVLDQFQHDYAKYIKYYGKVRLKDEVLREKAAFVKRWPERDIVRVKTASRSPARCYMVNRSVQ